jgi:glycosyltransferase involved in cell wall biosynthesis
MNNLTVCFLCNHVPSNLRDDFYYAESTIKKVNSIVDILESRSVKVDIYSLASPKKYKFIFLNKYKGLGFFYYFLRLFFEVWRFAHYLVVIGLRKNYYSTILSYSYTTQNTLLCFCAHHLFGMRIILDYEDGLIYHQTRSGYYKFLEKVMLKISDGVLIVNKGIAERLGNNTKFVLVNGGFNTSNLINRGKTSLDLNKPVSLLYTGEISRSYGLDMMLEFFKNNLNVKFDITGDGDDVEYLKGEIIKYNLKHVHFHGYVSYDKLIKLEEQAAALFLFQNDDSKFSKTNFPSKLFHYISLCKPVLVNKCQMFSEYEEFNNVFVVDPSDNMIDATNYIDREGVNARDVIVQMQEYNNRIGDEIYALIEDR